MPSRLEHKVAVVTGAASGIGRAITLAFAAEGATVAVADIDGDAADVLAREVGASGGEAIGVAVDVASSDAIARMAGTVAERLGRIDVLVNNAAIRYVKPLLDHSEEEWRHTLDVDLTGPFLCIKAVVPHMLRAGRGKIVNLASIASFVGRPDRVAYCAAKGGLLMLTRAAAIDLAHRNIYVNALAPGLIETPLNSLYSSDPARAETWASETLVGRWGQPEDVARAAVYLACDESDFMSGSVLPVDGGWLAARRRQGE